MSLLRTSTGHKDEREGLLFLLIRALLSGIFPVIAILSYKTVLPMDVLLWSTLFAAIYFACLVTVRKRWYEIKNTEAMKDMAWIVAITGVGYQMLFFFGLSMTTAGNAAIIALVEILFSFLFFHVWKKEHIPAVHIFGSILIIIGVAIILSPKFDGFHLGDVLIIAASAIAPVGNLFQRRVRKKISTDSLMLVRSVASGIVLLIIASCFHQHSTWEDVRSIMLLLIINGVFMLGITKSLWIEAIHRVSVTKANALGSLAPVFTLLIVWIFMHVPPTSAQLLSLAPILAGFFLLNGIGKGRHTHIAKEEQLV